ncbi:MAG: hypothetical protein ACKVUS_12320 [Saprospiraceae bacterium]
MSKSDLKEQDFRKGIFEALFWWQRSECQYSVELRNAFEKRHEKESVKLFVENSFYKFLTDYSIRRNLRGKGVEPVESFIKECFEENGLMDNLRKKEESVGDIIDKFVDKIKERDFAKGKKGGKRLTSLVAKTAFLFRPDSVPLYDQLAKQALEEIQGVKIKSFSNFLIYFESQKFEWDEAIRRLLKEQSQTMKIFKEFEGIENREDFFVHRTVDKLLWMTGKSMTKIKP